MGKVVKIADYQPWAYECKCGGTEFHLCAYKPKDVFDFFMCADENCGETYRFWEGEFKHQEIQILFWFASQSLSGGPPLIEALKEALKADKPNKEEKDKVYRKLIKAITGEDA